MELSDELMRQEGSKATKITPIQNPGSLKCSASSILESVINERDINIDCGNLTESESTKNDDDMCLSDTTPTNSPRRRPPDLEQHKDKQGLCYWHPGTRTIHHDKPILETSRVIDSVLICHDDEEINQITLRTSDSDDDDDYFESGAALTLDEASELTFVVYPMGCCEFDESKLVSTTNTRAIQKCILKLNGMAEASEENLCWGLDQSQPILMKLYDDYIQFTNLKTRSLLRSQPISTIKRWAVDDDNNFGFVIEDKTQLNSSDGSDNTLDQASLTEPKMVCYVLRSMDDDDDDMSCKVAAKLNEEINRYKEHSTVRATENNRLKQMSKNKSITRVDDDLMTDADDLDCSETSSDLIMTVKFIGKTTVPRPTGIEILNGAIDKCLAESSNRAATEIPAGPGIKNETRTSGSSMVDVELHISPSSIIVEDSSTENIIVECRIRYLTFMGISRRDIRWCGFIMQNETNRTFVAYCFESYPTAGPICDAIQRSCTMMFERVSRTSRKPETDSIIPRKFGIRRTLAKTLARIRLKNVT